VIVRPAFTPSFHVEVFADDNAVLFVSETEKLVLSGRLYCALAERIDGRRRADDLVELLSAEASPAEVYYALTQLEQRGLLAEADGSVPTERAEFWAAMGTPATAAESRVAETRVGLATFGNLAPLRPAEELARLGLRISGGGDFWIVLTDDYLQAGLAEFNTRALATRASWLLAKPIGRILWLGPVFRPGTTGCWECLAHRLRSNRRVEAFLQERRGTAAAALAFRATLPPAASAALGLVATEAARWIGTGGGTPLEGAMITVDLGTLETQKHALVRRPQCPRCGAPVRAAELPPGAPVLQSRPKMFTADGGHRIVPPEETLRRFGHHVSPITGVVSTLVRMPDAEDLDVHLYAAGHNFGRPGRTFTTFRRSLRSSSGGKGVTDAQARAGGMCEAIERWCGLAQGDEPRRRDTYRGLGDAAIHPNACALYSEAQYRTRERWNVRDIPTLLVPRPFDEGRLRDWAPVWSFTHKAWKYLPAAYCYYMEPDAGDAKTADCVADSNGCAAGNTLEEAIAQGFLELVERDSVALWWYNRLRRPAVDLDAFDDPFIRGIQARLRARGRELWVLDLTSDLGVPAFGAISRSVTGSAERIMLGFGAHFDPRLGVLRALTEHNQMYLFVAPLDDGKAGRVPDDPALAEWLPVATVADQPYLLPADGTAVTPDQFRTAQNGDLRDDVLMAQAIVERHGMELLVLDQTRADIGLPVVKVVVPGLRHFWSRFAPGRLYDVPVKMGWTADALTEDRLNPVPMFI